MPIVGKLNHPTIEYKIPNRIKNLFTDDFLTDFVCEVNKTFNINPVEVCNWDYYYITSTYEWCKSLMKACDNHKYKHMGVGIKRYYKSLSWYDSDLFDGDLVDIIVSKGLIRASSYEEYEGENVYKEKDGVDYKMKFKAQYNGYKVYEPLMFFEDGFEDFKGDSIYSYK